MNYVFAQILCKYVVKVTLFGLATQKTGWAESKHIKAIRLNIICLMKLFKLKVFLYTKITFENTDK